MKTSTLVLTCLALLAIFAGGPAWASSPETLPGGPRPLDLTLEGRWIGSGVCFSPFRRGQSPGGAAPSEQQILEDLRLVSRHWGLLRTYELLPMVETELALIRRHKLPLRLLLGIWIVPEKSAADVARNDQQVAAGIRTAREYPDLVRAVVVGNETQVEWSGIRTDPAVLIRRLDQVRAGITQPVTTGDDYNFWNKPASAAVAAHVDFITLHLYPLWNGRGLEEALSWTAGIYRDIKARHPARPVIIGETGWATSHAAAKNGPGEEGVLMKAETSEAAQETYLRQYYAWVFSERVPTCLFEAFDEEWKGSGSGKWPEEAEKHWGVFTEDRQPKSSFARILRDIPEATR